MINLRSDVMTPPTPTMHQAMFEAQLGDDGFGEEPTVKQLAVLVAMLLGKLVPMTFSKQ